MTPQPDPDSPPLARLASRPAAARPKVAVAIPCLNEEATIGKVVRDFRHALPDATVVVVDNGSTDRTAERARDEGALVLRENRPGKGHALQAAFSEVDADIYVLTDGDDTYPAEEVHPLIEPLLSEEVDLVVGERLTGATPSNLRPLHQAGNRLIVRLVNSFFGTSFTDILSGYRALSRRVVDNVPLVSPGFEIETELTIQALERGFVIREVPIGYRPRPTGSLSKLRTFRDGYRILITIAVLLRDHRPLFFFSTIAGFVFLLGVLLGILAVARPAAPPFGAAQILLAVGLVIVSSIVATGGLILNAVNVRVRELHSALMRLNRRR